jgi:enoyl-CoA hydratase/carnithine racemase
MDVMIEPLELDEIRLEIADGVAHVILDRPDMMNVISGRPGGTRDQILHAIEVATADGSVGCIILRGEGRAFSGGGDLTGNRPRETEAEDRAFLESAEMFHQALRASELPIVAAVHGYCLGAAVTMMTCCDIVIAADDARIGFPEGRLGLIGASSVVDVIGRQWAKFLMLTGENLTAAQAQQLGLVMTVEPAAELLDRVSDLAGRISRMPREGARLNRHTIDAAADAAGAQSRRRAAFEGDVATLGTAAAATAPDGRTFRSIIAAEGMRGLKAARAQQYETSWLRSS